MSASGDPKDGKAWINFLGLGILLVCYAGALWNVFSAKRQEASADVIRIAHWQLELGVRDGLQDLIDAFEAKKAAEGRPVKVVQLPIPERAYAQYVTTQLIGGELPDMIQIGKFQTEYLGRYFQPLSKVIQQPNPALTESWQALRDKADRTGEEEALLELLADLKDQPWMDSFTDGLRGQFQESFQEYFGVGFSTFTVRMFYNKDLFRRVLGHDRAPASYRELLETCRRIEAYAKEHGVDLLPIASSKYQVEVFRFRYLADLTADLGRDYDMDFSGGADGIEKLMYMLRGELTPWNPQYRAAVEVVQQMASFFPKGFMSLGREDSGFAFVQGRAGMITSGSWDARSFLQKIEEQPEAGRFEVGIFDLPSVAFDDPEFGRYADGRSSEAGAGTGFGFGITRATRHEDLCIEFLQFCTTPENNTRLNQAAEWIPVIHGAQASPLLEKFKPNYIGYFGRVDLDVMAGGKTPLLESQIYWPLVSGEIDYDTYADRLWKSFPPEAATDYKRMYEANVEALPARHARRSAYLANTVFGPPEERIEQETRLLRAWEPLLRNLVGQARIRRMMEITLESMTPEQRDNAFNREFRAALQREMSK